MVAEVVAFQTLGLEDSGFESNYVNVFSSFLGFSIQASLQRAMDSMQKMNSNLRRPVVASQWYFLLQQVVGSTLVECCSYLSLSSL